MLSLTLRKRKEGRLSLQVNLMNTSKGSQKTVEDDLQEGGVGRKVNLGK